MPQEPSPPTVAALARRITGIVWNVVFGALTVIAVLYFMALREFGFGFRAPLHILAYTGFWAALMLSLLLWCAFLPILLLDEIITTFYRKCPAVLFDVFNEA